MVEIKAPAPPKASFRQAEFLAFSAAAFIGKTMLLMRLPYREVWVNTLYTSLILGSFYCYFRFRQKMAPPLIVMFCLSAAVATDVLGNFFHLYGHEFGPLTDYDEFAHLAGSGLSAIPTYWLLRTTTRRVGLRLPADLMTFLAVTITFSFASYYEIVELWDEKFYGDFQRLWTPQDTPHDLQWDLFGIIFFALVAAAYYKIKDRREELGRDQHGAEIS